MSQKLIILLILLLNLLYVKAENFSIFKNRGTVMQSFKLILSLDTKSEKLCLKECLKNTRCLTVVISDRCFFYDDYFSIQNETVFTSNSNLYEKNSRSVNSNSLLNVFQYFTLNATINSYPVFQKFKLLQGSGAIIDEVYSTSKNYVLDSGNPRYSIDPSKGKIIEFDENWQFRTYKTSFYFPNRMISVNNTSLYITGYSNIYKTDSFLNIIKTYFSNGSDFTDLCFNPLSNSIFVVSYFQKRIYEFDINLNILSVLNPVTFKPYSIQGYNNLLYVGYYFINLLTVLDKLIEFLLFLTNFDV